MAEIPRDALKVACWLLMRHNLEERRGCNKNFDSEHV